MYRTLLDRKLHEIVDVFQDCEDILLNCLISHVTTLPPIKLFQVNQTENLMVYSDVDNSTQSNEYRDRRSLCIQAFSQHFIKFPYTGKQSMPNNNNQHTDEKDIPELYLPLYRNSHRYV
ncbi:unnamed protein product [Trichobilharzia regenti]|nr:unnamed protein product [Trichobilharzia regenti]